MSQSHNPTTDTQALLQSMLQRLKLQPARESQSCLHASVPIASASVWGQDGQRGASHFQRVNNSPVNGFESKEEIKWGFAANGAPSKDFVDSNLGLKGREIQQPSPSCEDSSLTSSSSQKDNIDSNRGENKAVHGITTSETGQLFPETSHKDADVTSFERTGSYGNSATENHIPSDKDATVVQSQDQLQGFIPRVYAWSLKTTETTAGTQETQVSGVGNGGFGALAQSKDAQIISSGHKTTNGSSRRKLRPSENKTRRWTQKIKEKWRDRPGSFGKKEKEEGAKVDQSEHGAENSPQNQPLATGNLIHLLNEEGERSLTSPNSSNHRETPVTQSVDSISEENSRPANDFDFGLGTFSLLDEIVRGQEWAKFLNPTLPAPTAHQRQPDDTLDQLKIPQNPYDSGKSSLISNQNVGGSNTWSLRLSSQSSSPDFSMAQVSPDASVPVNMDITDGKQVQEVHRQADQSEPMEHIQSEQSGLGQQLRPPAAEPVNIVDNSLLKGRLYINRKRQHQPEERRPTEMTTDGKDTGSIFSPSSCEMDETGGSQRHNITSLFIQNSSPSPLSPSTSSPCSSIPRGVLKYSVSQESESSMETLTKRRRVEDARHVHFSEEVVTIVPPELDLDTSYSEEDSVAEDDSVIEDDYEVDQAEAVALQEVIPARRPALPAWIRALKRKNTGRKHR
ncbi:uncharacterized protein LOC115427350 [Sphaeramia orbicularis]|uniref:uncharacterized protein LOC115427350 n=1 Tax=Sphaeramia orbicularis TaxID=375764 RepID=UPI0011809DB4|nr:uncharacterized protein LOC115427350 [Sphaeramia orbicularis]XP_030001737.1 uncharacterized protein LOC115427350 [Sphaeramia orbicularis]